MSTINRDTVDTEGACIAVAAWGTPDQARAARKLLDALWNAVEPTTGEHAVEPDSDADPSQFSSSHQA